MSLPMQSAESDCAEKAPPSSDHPAPILQLRALTVEDLAVIFRTSTDAIYKAIERGRLPRPAPTGTRRMLWSPRVIEAFLIGGMPAVEALGATVPRLPKRSPGRPAHKPLRKPVPGARVYIMPRERQ